MSNPLDEYRTRFGLSTCTVLAAIYDKQPFSSSRAGLIRHTGLRPPQVTAALKTLETAGVIWRPFRGAYEVDKPLLLDPLEREVLFFTHCASVTRTATPDDVAGQYGNFTNPDHARAMMEDLVFQGFLRRLADGSYALAKLSKVDAEEAC